MSRDEPEAAGASPTSAGVGTTEVGLVASAADVQACAFSAWYPQFAKVTIPSRIVPLPTRFVEYLLDDGPLVLPDSENPTTATFRDQDSDDEDSEQWEAVQCDDGDAAADTPAPAFPDLEARISRAIARLGGTVFPKLNWSAPRDVPWIMVDGTLRCSTPGDIFLLLKSSDFVTHDLTMPFDCCVDVDDAAAAAAPEVKYELVLRKWASIATSMEFRCFVREGHLVGISQRDHTNFYPDVARDADAIKADLVDFFDDAIRAKFRLKNFAFDVYRKDKGAVTLVDFNPLSPITDGLLFEWGELLPAAAEAAGTAAAAEPAEREGAGGADARASEVAAIASAAADTDAPVAAPRPTLTDKLNKSLLLSFLDRINDPTTDIPTYESDDDEWPVEETDDDRAREAAVHKMLMSVAAARGAGGESAAAAAAATPSPAVEPATAVADVDFRYVQSDGDARMRPSVYINSRVPQDILEVKTAEDIERLARMYKRGELRILDDDSDDETQG